MTPHLGAVLLLHIGGGAAGLLRPGGLMLAVLAGLLLLLVFVAAEAERESHLIGGRSDHILWGWMRSGVCRSLSDGCASAGVLPGNCDVSCSACRMAS